jgi:5-methylthioadenosine/S-adenosylhomocysteine deaminase
LLIHCVRVQDDDLRRIADRGAAIAHCPVANARLGHGTAPMVEARVAGIPVAIGTDSVASNNRIDLLEEARIAQIVQRARLCSTGAFTSDELLRMVTIDAARALGFDDRVGSIEPGKDADLCAVAFGRAHTIPPGDVTSTLFHAARGNDVTLTMVQGRTLFDDGRILTLSEADLCGQVSALGERLRMARDQSK